MRHAHAVPFVSGTLFALGLGLGGMTNPSKILGFLDFAGAWDPSLALVMASAVSVYAIAHRLTQRRAAPLLAERFSLPTRRDIDAPLVLGAILFGVGWGLSGYCPGPAVTSLVAWGVGAPAFLLTMGLGMTLYSVYARWRAARDAAPSLASSAPTQAPAPQSRA